MANAIYGKGRQAFADKQISWTGDTIKCVLIDAAAYTAVIDTHEFLSDIPAGARIGTPQTLAGKTNVLGVLDANDLSFTGLSAAPSLEALAIFQDTAVEGTSRLIAFIDTATGLPVAAGAAQVDVTWDSGANKIMKL